MSSPTAPTARRSVFDHEKLQVYQMQLRFLFWVSPLIEEAKLTARGSAKEVCDQLDRASLSTLLNTAEGNGKRRAQIVDEPECRCHEDSLDYHNGEKSKFVARKRTTKRKRMS